MKKLIKRGQLYTLISFSQPIIKDNRLLKDNNKGGILLVYDVIEVRYISLPSNNYSLYSRHKRHTLNAYFKPLKKDWNRDAYKISKVYWGRRNHLLTNLWLEVDHSFKDIFSIKTEKLKVIPQCKDKELIKLLNSRTEEFILSNIKNR